MKRYSILISLCLLHLLVVFSSCSPLSAQWWFWTPHPEFPDTLSRVAVADYEGSLWACGGREGFFPSNKAYFFDFDLNSELGVWNQLPNMSTARFDAAAVRGANETVYVIGGDNGFGPVNTAEVYHLTTNTWTTLAPLNVPRRNLGIAFVDGKLYAIGGETPGGLTHTVEVYDPVTNSWSFCASLPQPLAYMGSARANYARLIYTGGGLTFDPVSGVISPTDAVYEYNAFANSWSTYGQLPQPRYEGDLMVDWTGSMFFSGGRDNSSLFLDAVNVSPWGSFPSGIDSLPPAPEIHSFTWMTPSWCIKEEMGYLVTDGNPMAPFGHGRLTYAFILPVEDLNLKAVKEGNSHILTWQAPREVTTGNFVIEKSNDGAGFEAVSVAIPVVPGKEDYHWENRANRLTGIDLYRVRITDDAGNVYYSEKVAVQNEQFEERAWVLTPNPSQNGQGELVFLKAGPEEGYRIQITDLRGTTVWETACQPERGAVLDLPSREMEAGTYLIRIQGGGKEEVLRWMIFL